MLDSVAVPKCCSYSSCSKASSARAHRNGVDAQPDARDVATADDAFEDPKYADIDDSDTACVGDADAIPWRVLQRSALLLQHGSLQGTAQLPLTERALKAWAQVSKRLLRDPSKLRLSLQNACDVLEVAIFLQDASTEDLLAQMIAAKFAECLQRREVAVAAKQPPPQPLVMRCACLNCPDLQEYGYCKAICTDKGATFLTRAEAHQLQLPPHLSEQWTAHAPPPAKVGADAPPEHPLGSPATTPEATVADMDACTATTRSRLVSIPPPLRHLSHVAFQKILQNLPIHACAQLPLPLRLSALRDMLQVHACSPGSGDANRQSLFSLDLSGDGELSSVACARLFHLLPMLPPLDSLTISNSRFLKYNTPRPAHRRRLPPSMNHILPVPDHLGRGGRGRGWRGQGRGRGRGRGRAGGWIVGVHYEREQQHREAADEEKKLRAAAHKELKARTCAGMDAALYRALDVLAPSLRHLSLARSTVNARTLRVLCAKLQCLESLDLSHCKFVCAAHLRPLGDQFLPCGTFVPDQCPAYECRDLGETLTASLGLLRELRQLSLRGVRGIYKENLAYETALRLSRLTTLTSLDISDCGIRLIPDAFEAAHGLIAALRFLPHLQSLDISNNSIDREPGTIRFLAFALADHTQLKALDVSNTPFASEIMRGEDEGYPPIGVPTCLTSLKLSESARWSEVDAARGRLANSINVSGWRAVAESLRRVRGLKELHVEGHMHVKVLSHLMHTLAEHVTSLEALHLHSTELTSSHPDANPSQDRFDLQATLHSIARLQNLRELSLANCNLGFVVAHLWPRSCANACDAVVGKGAQAHRRKDRRADSTQRTCSHSYAADDEGCRIYRNPGWLSSIAVFDVSGNGLDDAQLPVLLEMLLGVHVVGATHYSAEVASGGPKKLKYRSWCDVNPAPEHSRSSRPEGDRHHNCGARWSRKLEGQAAYEACGNRSRHYDNACVEKRELGGQKHRLEGLRQCGAVLGSLGTLQKVYLHGNMLSGMGLQTLRTALRKLSTAEVSL